MRRTCIFVVLLLLAAAIMSSAQPLVRTLDNGARIIVEENHTAPIATVRFFVNTGSAFEGKYLGGGISHFVEHTAGEGSPSRTGAQIDRAMEELGNDTNAYTSKRVTVFHVTTAARDISKAIDILADYVPGATFPADAVETQRGIILREIARGDDDPDRMIDDIFEQTMFTVHPRRYRIIGYEDQFKALTRDDLVAYHRDRYAPDNIVAVVVGDVNASEIVSQLSAALGKYPRRAVTWPALPREPYPTSIRRQTVERASLQRAYLMLGFRSVDTFSPDMYPLDLASYILANGDASRLVSRLRDEQGLVDSIASYSDTPDYDAGSFVVSAVLDPANLDTAEAAILQELERLKSRNVSAAELERVKKQKEAELAFARETVEGRAEQLAYDLMLTGDIDFSRHYVDRIRKVTADDIRRAANKYLNFDQRVVAVLRPPVKPQAQQAAAQAAASQTVFKKLENGLRVVIKADPQAPTLHIVAAGAGGLRAETPQTNGITRLMTQMLVRGTQTRSRQQIANALESVGGSIGVFSGRNSFGLTVEALPADADRALDVLADCLQRPSFPPTELEAVRKLTIAAIAAQQDDVDTVAGNLLRQTLYATHPYRMDQLGTAESVGKLDDAAIRSFYTQVVRPSNMVLVIVGNVNPAATLDRLISLLGKWAPPQARPLPTPPVEPAVAAPREQVQARPQEQAIVMYGWLGPKVDDADRGVRDVMSAILAGAGMPGGRLFSELRGNQLVYAAFGYASPGVDPGFYAIYAGTPPDKVQAVRQIIERVVRGLAEQPVGPEELARGKEMVRASQDIGLANPGALAQTMALDELYGLGYDEYQSYDKRIEAVTAQQVQEQARRLLDFQHDVVIVTTPEQH